MNLGDSVRLKSVMFRDDVRLPGGSSSGKYIPTEDYPLRYYPALALIEARLRDAVMPMPGFTRTNWYPCANVRDMIVDLSSVEGGAAAPEQTNPSQVASPMSALRKLPGGGFERMTEEPPAPKKATAPAQKGKKAKAKASEPQAHQVPPAVLPPPTHARVHGGQSGEG